MPGTWSLHPLLVTLLALHLHFERFFSWHLPPTPSCIDKNVLSDIAKKDMPTNNRSQSDIVTHHTNI